MKKAAIAITGLMLVAVMGVSSAWADRIVTRHNLEKEHVRQGIHKGKLTRGEARALIQERQRIRQVTRMAWADGRLTPRERLMIERMQNRAHRHNRWLKHHQQAKR